MDRRGDGSASTDRASESQGELSDGDGLPGVASRSSQARAAELPELSRRALSAEVDLLAYVDKLEAEVRRLRRRLGIDAPYETAEGTAQVGPVPAFTLPTGATDADATAGG